LNAQSNAINGNEPGSSAPISMDAIILDNKDDTTNQIPTMTDVNGTFYINVSLSDKSSEAIPFDFALDQNYPNSFSTYMYIL